MVWSARLIKHRNEERIGVEFEKDKDLIRRIKLIDGARWSQQKRIWHIPDTSENRQRFKIVEKQVSELSAGGKEHLSKFTDMLSAKRYSQNTIKTYAEALRSFLLFFREKEMSEITNSDVIYFNTEFILKNNFSASSQNQITSALKLYFKTVRET